MTTQFEIQCALMAGHVYRTTRPELNWIPAPQGWTPFFPVPDPTVPLGSVPLGSFEFLLGNLGHTTDSCYKHPDCMRPGSLSINDLGTTGLDRRMPVG